MQPVTSAWNSDDLRLWEELLDTGVIRRLNIVGAPTYEEECRKLRGWGAWRELHRQDLWHKVSQSTEVQAPPEGVCRVSSIMGGAFHEIREEERARHHVRNELLHVSLCLAPRLNLCQGCSHSVRGPRGVRWKKRTHCCHDVQQSKMNWRTRRNWWRTRRHVNNYQS